eukprot:scaffold491087_cov46-Prasinocladus_malaysianus.AAC.1
MRTHFVAIIYTPSSRTDNGSNGHESDKGPGIHFNSGYNRRAQPMLANQPLIPRIVEFFFTEVQFSDVSHVKSIPFVFGMNSAMACVSS